MMKVWMRLLLAAVLFFAAVACGGDDDDADATGTDTGSPSAPADDEGDGDEPIALTITAEDYTFDAAEELDGGIVELTLANEGNFVHEAGFIKVADDYDLETFEEDFSTVIEGGPIPESLETITGVGDTEPGAESTSTITLPEGNYVLFCSLDDSAGDEGEDGEGEEGEGPEGAAEGDQPTPPPHYTLGMAQMVSVTGGADAAAADIESDGVIQAVDYGFEVPELEAGSRTLTFENTSDEQLHHGIFFEFPEGTDEAAAQEALQGLLASEGGPPPEGTPEPDEAGFTFVFGPGMGGTFELELESGRTYGVVCFIQDRTGGPPHVVAHEMAEFFTVG